MGKSHIFCLLQGTIYALILSLGRRYDVRVCDPGAQARKLEETIPACAAAEEAAGGSGRWEAHNGDGKDAKLNTDPELERRRWRKDKI
jgi:hypothetical protein